MSAELDAKANAARSKLLRARAARTDAEAVEARTYLTYIRDALSAGWSFRRIGEGVGVTEAAIRRYWIAHRHEVGRLPK